MKTSRRAFLESAASAASSLCGGCALVDRLGTPAPVKIIDAHVHFYDPSRPQGIPWPPKTDALLYRPALPALYRAQAQPQQVDGVVAVEASPWVEDNQWLLDLAADEPLIVGMVGNLPIGTAEFPGLLERFSAHPLFRGVRVREGSLKAGLSDPLFLRDMRSLAERGLCFDVHAAAPWVEQAAALARAVPELRLVVNHVAGVPVTGGRPPEAWRSRVLRLAEQPRVFMKVSGLVSGTGRRAGDAPSDVAFYEPVLETLWRAFGEERLVYGSDWPVSGRFAGLATVQQIAIDFFAAKGRGALDKVFWKNARAAYRCG